MQFQKNKLDSSERSNDIKDISTSNLGEMAYIEPLGNQIISPISVGAEKSSDLDERIKNKEKIISNPLTEKSPNIIKKVENDLKAKVDISQFVEEKPIGSIVVNIPSRDINYMKVRSPKSKNLRNVNEKMIKIYIILNQYLKD